MSDSSRKEDLRNATVLGQQDGESAGSWMFDGNTTDETYRHVLRGIEEGDPEVLDMMGAPLSGEWAGRSIMEIFGHDATDEEMDAYEEAYALAYWDYVESTARAHLGA